MKQVLVDRAEAPFSIWQRDLVHRGGRGAPKPPEIAARQEEMREAVQAGPRALGPYLRSRLDLGPEERIGAPSMPREALTVSEYLNPPVALEAELGRAWEDVPAGLASRPTYWLLCHIQWIEEERFGNGSLRPCLMDGPGSPDMERQTRNLLRRTGGIPHVRGRTSVFSDCTLARAWWRHRLARDAAVVVENLSPSDAHHTLHASRPAWERLVMLSLRRLTVLNQPRARGMLVRTLAERLRRYGAINEQQVLLVSTVLARLGLRYSLDHAAQSLLARAADTR